MARLTATDIARTFGTPKGNTFFGGQPQRPRVNPQIPAVEGGQFQGGGSGSSGGVTPPQGGVGQPSGTLPPTQTPQTTPQADAGSQDPNQQMADIFGRLYEQALQQQPNDTGGGSVPGQTGGAPAPSFSRPQTNPQLQIPEGFGNLGGAGGTQGMPGGGQFTPQAGDTQIDPALLAQLQGRAQGEGMVGLEQILEGVGRPELALMEEEFAKSQEQVLQDLVSRGILSSSEARNRMEDISQGFARQKGALLGQLGLQHETMKQDNINQAFQQLTGLELGRVQANTAITTANIGAAAQVQSAAIGAQATTQSATIRSRAQLQAAQLSAQASLQQAGMNYNLAIKQLDQKMSLQGIDPVRFENDPLYRGDMIDYMAQRQKAKDLLIEAQIMDLTGMGLPAPAGG